MLRERQRIASTSLSAKIVAHLVGLGMTQADIAGVLNVSPGFVSLVKQRERGLTIDHITAISDHLDMPVGVFLMSVSPPRTSEPKTELQRIVQKLIPLAHQAEAAIRAELKVRNARA